MNIGRRHGERGSAASPAGLDELGLPSAMDTPPERLGRVIRGLASDLVEERRRSNALEREVRELKAQLAEARRARS
jgi:hypothetical protein